MYSITPPFEFSFKAENVTSYRIENQPKRYFQVKRN
jgi:hypothetical protein